MGKRARLVGAIVVVLAGGLAVGWVAAARTTSPEQRAADAGPPEAEPILEPVVVDALVDELTVRATVERQVVDAIGPPSVEGEAIVTTSPLAVGQVVAPGTVVATVNSRPVLVLAGSFPLYRDLGPGDVGIDVQQLHGALGLAGMAIPAAEARAGRVGAGTVRALRTLYERAGWELPTRPAEADPAPAPPPAAGDAGAATAVPPATPAPVQEAYLRRAEVLVAPELPATAVGLPRVGAAVGGDGAFLRLARGSLVVRAELPASTGLRVRPGMAATAEPAAAAPTGDASGDEAAPRTGRVATVVESTGETEGAGFVLTLGTDAPVPAAWEGDAVLVRITLAAVAEEGLVVPTRALSARADGTTTVTRRRDGGALTRVEVDETGELAGRSAVVPVEEGALTVGDEVRVG